MAIRCGAKSNRGSLRVLIRSPPPARRRSQCPRLRQPAGSAGAEAFDSRSVIDGASASLWWHGVAAL